jgi:hypothetical protein
MDKASTVKSWDAANYTWRAALETGDTSGTRHARDEAIDGQAEHASCATTEARATEHSAGTVAKSTAAETDANAAFYPADETGSGG